MDVPSLTPLSLGKDGVSFNPVHFVSHSVRSNSRVNVDLSVRYDMTYRRGGSRVSRPLKLVRVPESVK